MFGARPQAADLTGLGEPYANTNPYQRMLTTRRTLRISDLPDDYRRTTLYQEVLRPAGFGDGMSTCLFAADGAYAGMSTCPLIRKSRSGTGERDHRPGGVVPGGSGTGELVIRRRVRR